MISDRIKTFLKTRPRLFDAALRLRPIRGAVDRFLADFSQARDHDVSFIQIGASDGLRWDPLRRYIVKHRWSGILVEPVPAVFDLLKTNYAHATSRLQFVNAAVGAKSSSSALFWTFRTQFLDELPLEVQLYYLRKSSFDKEHVVRAVQNYDEDELRFLTSHGHIPRDIDAERVIVPRSVRCMTVEELCIEFWSGGAIDLIVLDAEGHEATIIPSLDFTTFRPAAILFESHNLGASSERVFRYLKEAGYRIMDLDGDAVAIDRGASRGVSGN